MRQVLITIVSLVVAMAVYLAFTGLMAVVEARSAAASVEAAKQAARERDFAGVIESVRNVRAAVLATEKYLDGPEWWLARVSPIPGAWLGPALDLLASSTRVADASGDFLEVAGRLGTSGNPNAGNKLPIEDLRDLGPAAAELSAALTHYENDLENLDNAPLPAPVSELVTAKLGMLKDGVQAAISLLGPVQALPVLLGINGPQTWFIAMQNGGESRGTGGLVGAYALARVDAGKVQEITKGKGLTALADTSSIPQQTLDLYGAHRMPHIWGVNLSPHYPFAGALLTSLVAKQLGTKPDVVLAIDQPTIAALLNATGPVTVDGVTVSSADALRFLTVGVYQRFPITAQKNEFVVKLIGKILARLASGSVSMLAVAEALIQPVKDRGLLLWSANPATEDLLSASAVGGSVPTAPGPLTMAVVNNNAGSKMDTFLHTDVQYTGGQCLIGGRRSTLKVTLRNDPPSGLPAYVDQRTDRRVNGGSGKGDGSNRVRLNLYLPLFSHVVTMTENGKSTQWPRGADRDHPVLVVGVELARKQAKTFIVEFTEFGTPETLNREPQVLPQPMLNPQRISVQRGPTCT